MRALLDVNALIALLDEEHQFHANITAWLGDESNRPHGFATCAITQLGAIRVMSGKGYYEAVPPHVTASHLERITRTGHLYLDIPEPCEAAIRWTSLKSAHSTDAVLLATAVAHGCRLVTFDAGIQLGLVGGAKREHLVVLSP